MSRDQSKILPAASSGPVTLTTLICGVVALFSTLIPVPVQAQSHGVDFTGVWGHGQRNYPKPYTTGRDGPFMHNITNGFNNEYLKPWVVDALERDNLVTKSGRAIVTRHAACYPDGIPAVFGIATMQMLQTPSEITMLFDEGPPRVIYMNRPHSAHVVPSWYGESVGHFEGDNLVVDTVGIVANVAAGSMGGYGTPHTDALHVVERYRYLAADEKSLATSPTAAGNPFGSTAFDPKDIIAGGKTMRLTFTLDDPGAYKKPWSVTLDYLPLKSSVREYICAENSREGDLAAFLPRAERPDF